MAEEAANGTASAVAASSQRRQLLSKNSVTAAFSAPMLWAAGYHGKGVKMGVFDTGIRDDHPHVKNIKYAPVFCPASMFPTRMIVAGNHSTESPGVVHALAFITRNVCLLVCCI
jgi:subtilisin family serine protease